MANKMSKQEYRSRIKLYETYTKPKIAFGRSIAGIPSVPTLPYIHRPAQLSDFPSSWDFCIGKIAKILGKEDIDFSSISLSYVTGKDASTSVTTITVTVYTEEHYPWTVPLLRISKLLHMQALNHLGILFLGPSVYEIPKLFAFARDDAIPTLWPNLSLQIAYALGKLCYLDLNVYNRGLDEHSARTTIVLVLHAKDTLNSCEAELLRRKIKYVCCEVHVVLGYLDVAIEYGESTSIEARLADVHESIQQWKRSPRYILCLSRAWMCVVSSCYKDVVDRIELEIEKLEDKARKLENARDNNETLVEDTDRTSGCSNVPKEQPKKAGKRDEIMMYSRWM